jgi:ABC-type multidrug transport system fused ATPase/permease subunit
LGIQTAKSFILFIIAVLIFVYIFKNLYLFCEYYVQYRFIYKNQYGTQCRLMQVYLKRPYEFFLYAESGEIMRIITGDTGNAFNLLSMVLAFFTEGVVGVALIFTIIITDPLMAVLLAVILGGLLILIGKLIKPVLRKAGLSRQKNSAKMYQWLLQSISGIKEVKVAGKESYFLEQFSRYGSRFVVSEQKNSVLGTVPRLSIEAFGISSMLVVIAILMWSGREINSMLPQLTAFAMAAVRLMPSVNRMSSSLNQMSYYEPALDKLLEHLSEAGKWEMEQSKEDRTADGSRELTLEKKLEFSDITYTYPNATSPVLCHANMEIPIGASVGVIGQSGSGKTTAIDILLGLLQPQEGKVLADGVDIQKNYTGWLHHIGYIPQMIFMLDDTIRANVAFGILKEKVDEDQVWKVLEEAQLKDFIQSLPKGLDTTIGERGIRLSGGQRQRIGIARALYTDPDLLIFDEATSALDNETEAAIMESIHALHGKKTMVIIAHRLTTIEECDLVYRVENGKIRKAE